VENLAGGDGSDILSGNASANELFGFSGNDVLNCGWGDDYLSGSDGDDKLDGGVGADIMNGGPDSDWADYSSRTAPLVIDLGGLARSDGEAGEHDTVAGDVENLQGGSGNDLLTGSDLDNIIRTGGGDDICTGFVVVDCEQTVIIN
jgi:Ca2+-binding RTX toxin-like protein